MFGIIGNRELSIISAGIFDWFLIKIRHIHQMCTLIKGRRYTEAKAVPEVCIKFLKDFSRGNVFVFTENLLAVDE